MGNNNNNNNDFISIALFHAKHAQLHWTMSMNNTHTHHYRHLHRLSSPLSPSSPTLFQPFRPSTQLIQTRWSKACTPPLPSWQLSSQYPSSGCLLMWDWQETKKQIDLQKSAVRLRRHRIHIVTYRETKTLLHSRYNGDWKKHNGGYQAHLDPIWRLERAQQTTIFRLRTGHCGLSAHLKRIGISDTSLCECGQADQTPDHVLQSCPKYAERRQLTWPQSADLPTKLWGSAEDLYQTAGFVASTGLKIWPARLSTAEEEEEEVHFIAGVSGDLCEL